MGWRSWVNCEQTPLISGSRTYEGGSGEERSTSSLAILHVACDDGTTGTRTRHHSRHNFSVGVAFACWRYRLCDTDAHLAADPPGPTIWFGFNQLFLTCYTRVKGMLSPTVKPYDAPLILRERREQREQRKRRVTTDRWKKSL